LAQKQHYYHHHHHEKINDNNSDKRKQQPQKKRKKQLNNIRRLGAMLQIRRMVVDGSYYVDGLLSYMADLPASIMVATTAGAIMAAVIARALDKSDYSFWLAGIFKSCKGTIFHNGITW
jgi:hypothetical protein